MLDYFSKNGKAKARSAAGSPSSSQQQEHPPKQPPRPSDPVDEVPVLDCDEQAFLEHLTLHWAASDDDLGRADVDHNGEVDGERPPLPPRIKTPDLTWDSDSESFVKGERLVAVDNDVLMPDGKKKHDRHEKHESGGVGRRLSTLFSSRKTKAGDKDRPHPAHLVVPGQVDVDAGAASAGSQVAVVSETEEEREREDLARVLDDLELRKDDNKGKQSKTNKFAVSLSAESAELVRRFVVVLKDLVRGVPTAADDLKSLLDDRDGALQRGFERLPSSLRKLVTQLPSKLTSSLGPEILATAAASQGIKYEVEEKQGGGVRAGAKALLLPLITKPNALVKMLKAIMNALKLRWPAFIGTSAIWSVALFLLLFVLWYCHKRGREVRLEKEANDAPESSATDGAPADADDAQEPPIVIKRVSPEDGAAASTAPPASSMPRPPIGPDAPK